MRELSHPPATDERDEPSEGRWTPLWNALAARLFVLVVGTLTIAMFYPRQHLTAPFWYGDDPNSHTLLEHVAKLGHRWDAEHFVAIAEHGYREAEQLAFFPAYPMTLRALHVVTQLPMWLVGTLVSLACLAGTAVLLTHVARALPGADAHAARRARLMWLFFPYAAILGAIYAESMMAFALALTWFFAQHGQVLRSGLVAGLALLVKPFGLAAFAFVLFHRPGAWSQPRTWAGVGAGAAVASVWPAYLWIAHGSPIAFASSQEKWARETPLLGPVGGFISAAQHALTGIVDAVTQPVHIRPASVAPHLGDAVGTGMINFVSAVVFLGMVLTIPLIWRRVGTGPALATAAIAVIALTLPGTGSPGVVAGRYVLYALPWFVGMAQIVRGRRYEWWLVASCLLLGWYSAGWTLGQWPD